MTPKVPALCITTCYRFLPLTREAVTELTSDLKDFAADQDLCGQCLLGPEGINLGVAGHAPNIAAFKSWLAQRLNIFELEFKDGACARLPFDGFRVKTRREIVSMGQPGTVPPSTQNYHLEPHEWKAALSEPGVVVLDTRNSFEIELGKFDSAIDLALEEFGQFPLALKNANLDKTQKTLIYCTGGIRCEKAILEMHAQGFTDVHQLNGGILNYLKEFPEQEFGGECFVFDYRVAVDQHLRPTAQYDLCSCCGQPGQSSVTCVHCQTSACLCRSCESRGIKTCSKNCRHHVQIGSAPRSATPNPRP